MRRFDERVLYLMAHDVDVPLALSNLAARAQVGAAHIHITRHLPLQGARLTALADMAGMSKQAMGDLVDQCAAWGLVQRQVDLQDARAKRVVFTADGLAWLQAFKDAVAQAGDVMLMRYGRGGPTHFAIFDGHARIVHALEPARGVIVDPMAGAWSARLHSVWRINGVE